jgi:hypothetical protein
MFARMPRRLPSSAVCRMSPASPAFEASYATRPEPDLSPAIDEMNTIDDPSARRGSASRQQSIGPRMFTAKVASHSSATTRESPSAPTPMPTLHTIPSSPPRACSASATIRTTWSSCAMSASTTCPCPPSFRIVATVVSALSRPRSATATHAPSRAKRSDMARPFPIGFGCGVERALPAADDEDPATRKPPAAMGLAARLGARRTNVAWRVGHRWSSYARRERMLQAPAQRDSRSGTFPARAKRPADSREARVRGRSPPWTVEAGGIEPRTTGTSSEPRTEKNAHLSPSTIPGAPATSRHLGTGCPKLVRSLLSDVATASRPEARANFRAFLSRAPLRRWCAQGWRV